MRDKRTFLLCLLILALMELNAQNTLYSYNGFFRVALPSKLELQNSELNTIRKNSVHGEVRVNITSEAGHITFQQKGLNADEKGAYSKYCRVIIEHFNENRNDPTFGRGDRIMIESATGVGCLFHCLSLESREEQSPECFPQCEQVAERRPL